jgi:recombination protein RecA
MMMATASKRKQQGKEVERMLSAVNKKLSREVAKPVGESLMSEVKTWISTGVPTVDLLLGGGIPIGKVTEVHGAQKCGKSTFALQVCINARKQGGMVFYLDVEHTLEKERVQHIGVDLDDPLFVVLEPSTLEEGFRAIHNLIKATKEAELLKDIPFFLVVWDTLAFTASETEFDDKGEFKHDMGKRAGRIRQYMRRMLEDCAASNVGFISLNHETESMDKYKLFSTPGGTAMKYAASLVVRMIPVNGNAERILNRDEEQIGMPVRFKIIFTRLSPPKREVEGMMNFYSGFDAGLSSIRYLKDPETRMLEKKGNNYIIKIEGREETLISTGPAGEQKFLKLWKEDDEFRTAVIAQMKTHYEKIIPWKNPNAVAEDAIPIDIGDDFEAPAFASADEEEKD